MVAFGSLVFCDDCGNILDSPASSKTKALKCGVCGRICKNTAAKVVTAKSKPSDFPSAIRNQHSEVQTLSEEDTRGDAIIQETCEKCGRKEVRYTTQQLRSADEGSTIFYSCQCGHKWTVNN